jgi:glycosyltransferase involved in cell wall biosynthesis
MRVLLVSPSYAPVVGGLQTAVGQIARALSEAGHAVVVLANRYPRALPAAECREGIPVRRMLAVYPDAAHLRAGRADLWLYGLWARARVRVQLGRLVTGFQPDAVHAHFADGICAWLPVVRRPPGCRLVVTLHGHDIESLAQRSPVARRRALRLLAAADALTAPSAYLLDRALQWMPASLDRACVIPNGVAVEHFHNVRPHTWPRPYVLGLGRLVPKKGFDLLIEAFAGLPGGCDLLIAGEGPERPTLEALRERLQLRERAHLLGAADRQTCAALLAGARLVAIPSRQEPFGLVALEAWAAGAPIVATRAGGLPETLAGSGALFAEPGSAASLREALAHGLSTARAPAGPLPAAYRWETIIQRYMALYAPHSPVAHHCQ